MLQGMNLTVGSCQDGDMSQLFAATYKARDGSAQKENLMPLFWATSAYVGNGAMGLRVQAESAADGIFQLLVSIQISCWVDYAAQRCSATSCLHRQLVASFTANLILPLSAGSSTTTMLVVEVTVYPQAIIACIPTRHRLQCLSAQQSDSDSSTGS